MSTPTPLANNAATAIPNPPQPGKASTQPCTSLPVTSGLPASTLESSTAAAHGLACGAPPQLADTPMALSMGSDYLTKFIIKSNKKEKGNGKDSTVKPEKPHFKLQVTAKFDEKLLAEYFARNCDLAVLRDATFEWMDEEWLLIKPAAGKYARQNTVVKLLQTPEACVITTVLDIDTTPLDDYLTDFLLREDEKGTKNYFELHVNAKFNEELLEECFKLVGTDDNLRSAKLEWLDGERVLVKCKESIRKNALIRALRTEEARAIISVYHIQDADLSNRQASKKYRAAAGRVLTPEAFNLLQEKLERQKDENTRLTNEASVAHAENSKLKLEAAEKEEKIKDLQTEVETLKAAASGEGDVGTKRARTSEPSDLQVELQQTQGLQWALQEQVGDLRKQTKHLRRQLVREQGTAYEDRKDAGKAQKRLQSIMRVNGKLKTRSTMLGSRVVELRKTVTELKRARSKLETKVDEARSGVQAEVREATHAARSDLLVERRKLKDERRRRRQTIGRLRKASNVCAKIRAALQGRNPALRRVVVQQMKRVTDITEERIQREWDAMDADENEGE